MARGIAKQTEVVIVGENPIIRLIHRLVLERTKNCMTASPQEFRFLDEHVVSINGTKVYANKVIILKELKRKIPDINGVKQLIVKADGDSHLIVGSNQQAVCMAMKLRGQEKSVALTTLDENLLKKYDFSVQEVFERHLKKIGVKLHLQTALLSFASKDNKNFAVGETDGVPVRFSVENVHFCNDGEWTMVDDLGLMNTPLEHGITEISKSTTIQKGSRNTLIVPTDTEYTLAEIEKVVKFAWSNKFDFDRSLEFHEGVCDKFRYFTVGTREQDVADIHVAYKKGVAKINVINDGPLMFIKFITTTNKNIVGVSGIVPVDIDTAMFRYLVEEKMHVKDARRLIDATSQIALAVHEVTEGLS